jgi:hypothetical protein
MWRRQFRLARIAVSVTASDRSRSRVAHGRDAECGGPTAPSLGEAGIRRGRIWFPSLTDLTLRLRVSRLPDQAVLDQAAHYAAGFGLFEARPARMHYSSSRIRPDEARASSSLAGAGHGFRHLLHDARLAIFSQQSIRQSDAWLSRRQGDG